MAKPPKPSHYKGKSCKTKSGRYDTEDEAEQALEKWMKRNPGAHERITYYCKWCRFWHFGRKPGWGRPPRSSNRSRES